MTAVCFQRKSLSSFYHSTRTSLLLFFPPLPFFGFFYYFLLSFLTPSLSPICFLSRCTFFPCLSSFLHLRLSLQRADLHVCVLAVWARSCQNLLHVSVFVSKQNAPGWLLLICVCADLSALSLMLCSFHVKQLYFSRQKWLLH